MKKVITFSLLFVSLLFSTSLAFAQTKIGHLNSVELLSNMAEFKSAQKQLETFTSQLGKQLEAKEKALQTEYQALVEKEQKGLLPPVEAQKKGQALQQKVSDLEKEKVSAQQKVMEKEQALIKPIQDKVRTAIKAVAEAQGYNYIIDQSVGSLLFVTDSQDITSLVKARL